MIPLEQSAYVAHEAADAIFGAGTVKKIAAAPTQDSEGQDVLEISIEVADDFSSLVTGDQIVDVLSRIKSTLEASGEGRRPLVRYVSKHMSDL